MDNISFLKKINGYLLTKSYKTRDKHGKVPKLKCYNVSSLSNDSAPDSCLAKEKQSLLTSNFSMYSIESTQFIDFNMSVFITLFPFKLRK